MVIRRTGFPVVIALLVAVVAIATPDAQRSTQERARTQRPGAAKRITPQQIERVEARIATALGIVNRLEPQAKALGRAPGWRLANMNMLLSLSTTQLRQVEQQALTADSIPAVIAATADDPLLIGESDEDLVYMPLVPCRYVDTRNIGGKITGDRNYDIDPNGSAYGGDATCDPTTAPHVGNGDDIGAVAMNVTIVDPDVAPGFVAIKPQPVSPTVSLVNWYEAGPNVQAANMGVVSTHQGAGTEFTITSSAAVHVIVDLFGLFIAPEATPLDTVTATTPWSTSGAGFNVVATCPAQYSIAGGGWNQDVGVDNGVNIRQSSRDGTNHAWRCRGIATAAGTQSGYCEAICVRTPGVP